MSLMYIISRIQDGHIDPNPKWGVPEEEVVSNRTKLMSSRGLKNFVRMRAVHGNEVHVITGGNRAQWENKLMGGPVGDALVTKLLNIGLECDPGDCAMYIFFHGPSGTVGLAHSGREGSIRKVAVKTVEVMASYNGCSLEQYVGDVRIIQAPAICAEHYRMDYLDVPRDDVEDWRPHLQGAFDVESTDKENYVRLRGRDGPMGIDFVGYNASQLCKIGIKKEHLQLSSVCTYESEDYPSHHKAEVEGAKNGRFMVMAWMSDN
ncbi:uncharacterized protein LOC106164276 [Lingula anatina]|uniref:Uncharacterized protein LOC106164276 n=1 Tax=Lingula anatina TaxID=7574 RepID=A0A1S3IH69_LINAN|nr:uncharacterized protein LOC106164276 [Lingula anatina]|eukprot:XP_013397600.1 uncharacterized protein LOC106164276 [Lingula anatina]